MKPRPMVLEAQTQAQLDSLENPKPRPCCQSTKIRALGAIGDIGARMSRAHDLAQELILDAGYNSTVSKVALLVSVSASTPEEKCQVEGLLRHAGFATDVRLEERT